MESGLFSLSGKTALVIGGSRGIGFAVAKGLAEHGANVAIIARTKEQLEASSRQIQADTGLPRAQSSRKRSDEDFNEWVLSKTPLGRWGQPEDLVGTAVLLASKAGDFITGQIIYVDGGWLAML